MTISVSTEITEERAASLRGWVLYDAECPFCLGWVRRMKPVLAPRGFAFVPLQTPWVRAFFHLPEDELLSEMRVVFSTGDNWRDGQNERVGRAWRSGRDCRTRQTCLVGVAAGRAGANSKGAKIASCRISRGRSATLLRERNLCRCFSPGKSSRGSAR